MKLSAYLALSGRTATDLAAACDVSVPTISRIARGLKRPSLDLIERIRGASDGAVRADDFLPPYVEAVADAKAAA